LSLSLLCINCRQTAKKTILREEGKGEREKTRKPAGVFRLTLFFLEARFFKGDFFNLPLI
jgi:hypothetical protein